LRTQASSRAGNTLAVGEEGSCIADPGAIVLSRAHAGVGGIGWKIGADRADNIGTRRALCSHILAVGAHAAVGARCHALETVLVRAAGCLRGRIRAEVSGRTHRNGCGGAKRTNWTFHRLLSLPCTRVTIRTGLIRGS
jgi:hypothetical protein